MRRLPRRLARLPLYRAANLFHPLRFLAETERAGFQGFVATAIDLLTSLKGMKNGNVQLQKIDMSAQMIAYQQACREHARHLQANPKEDTPPRLWEPRLWEPRLWEWWVSLSAAVPAWFSVARVLVLLQPTSAAIERFFSLVKANTSPLQNKEHDTTFETRCMYLYNHGTQ